MQGLASDSTPADPCPPGLPEPWRAALAAQLAAGERVLGWLRTDLDAQLRYGDGLVVLTDRRWLGCGTDAQDSRSWPLRPDLEARLQDHAGVGTLELVDAHARLSRWRYTLARQPEAQRLAAAWQALREPARSGAPADAPAAEPA
ncbi:ABC transporter, partial [Castellaniella defragrans]